MKNNLFNIPANYPFVDALATSLLAETADAPLALSNYQILLPTRRACRALQEAFLRYSKGSTVILPKLTPLGDLESDELEFEALGSGQDLSDIDLDPPTSALTRQFLLCQLIMKLPVDSGGANEIDSALDLAGELAQLLDQVETEGLDWANLDKLIDDDQQNYQAHWQKILQFLTIVADSWPKIEASLGTLGPATRRRMLLEQQRLAWERSENNAPVIIAGSTGSIPAVANLIKTIAQLPNGRIVLPGLEQHHSEERWGIISDDPSHPQFGLSKLLQFLECDPKQVSTWPLDDSLRRADKRRGLFLSAAMLPAIETSYWKEAIQPDEKEKTKASLSAVELIECAQPEEEAGVIAMILRQALEKPNQTAALITPDRDLARRTAAILERWQIPVDDSAGQPLSNTKVGTFMRLIAWAAAEAFSPSRLLALIKHPLVQLKIGDQSVKYLIRLLELQSLRGSRPSPGLKALQSKLSKDKDQELVAFLETLEDLAQPFTSALSKGSQLFELLTAHLKLAEALCAPEDHDDHPLWRGDDGNALNAFFSELLQTTEATGQGLGAITSASYPTLLENMMQKQTVRPNFGTHPRLAIWGTIEGRLQQADVLVLGGLNENTWPKESDPGPWMSRAMRRDFGLPPVERKIGLSAHDFSQVFNARQVFLTRSLKVGGAPAISSRWLMRINCLLDASGIGRDFLTKDKPPWKDWLEELNKGPEIDVAIQRPAPRPPAEKRLRDITVTEVETWVKNPYAIYAKKLLRLRQLDPLDADPGAAEKGTLIHEALEIFVKRYPKELPPDANQVLREIGYEVFDEWLDRPNIWAFWWPRFNRIVDWFIAQEKILRATTIISTVEERGKLFLPSAIGEFELRGIADRINIMDDGSLVVIDYKTGSAPSKTDVKNGSSPQLPLEAAMLANGQFTTIPNGHVSHLAYWVLKGGVPAGEVKLMGKGDEITDLADQAINNLQKLIDLYHLQATAFEAVAPEEGGPRYDPYIHLARTKEWYGIDQEVAIDD